MGMDVRFLNEDEYSAWEALVAESPYASVFDECRWFKAVADVLGCEIEVAGAFMKDELLGGLVLDHGQRHGMPTATLPPLCHTNTCVVKVNPDASPIKQQQRVLDVTRAIAEFLRDEFSFAVVTNHPAQIDIRGFRWRGWRTNILYTYRLDLQNISLETISASKRRSIRLARRQALVVEDDTDSDAVSDLLRKTGERQGFAPSVKWPQLAALREAMAGDLLIKTAFLPGEHIPLATVISLADRKRDTAYMLMAGFDPSYADLQASPLALWESIEHWRDQGLRIADLVGADVESNVPFKMEFGGALVPYFQVSYVRTAQRVASALLGR